MPRRPSNRTERLYLRVSPELKQRLLEQAKLEETTPAELGARVLERYLHPPDDLAAKVRRLEQLQDRLAEDLNESREIIDWTLDRHVQVPPIGRPL